MTPHVPRTNTHNKKRGRVATDGGTHVNKKKTIKRLTASGALLVTLSPMAQTLVGVGGVAHALKPSSEYPQTQFESDLAAYQTAKAQYDRDKAAYDADKAQYDQDLAAYQAANTSYQMALAKYQQDKAVYDQKKVEYEAAMAKAEQNKNTPGYLSKPAGQTLVFKTEPGASIKSISTTGRRFGSRSEIERHLQAKYAGRVDAGAIVSGMLHGYKPGVENAVGLSVGDTATVRYTNLSGSTLNGVKIGEVEYKYTLVESPDGKSELVFYEDPTETLRYSNAKDDGRIVIRMEARFFDTAGNPLESDGILSFSSLNKTVGSNEFVQNFSGEFIPITGSGIGVAGGVAIAQSPNEGAEYSGPKWDESGNPNEYYGAIAGKATGPISLEFGATDRPYIWFAFNSDVKAIDVPIVPTPPTPPVEPKAPKAPTPPPAPPPAPARARG